MTEILACRPMLDDPARYEIVQFDTTNATVGVVERDAEWSLQAPKLTPSGTLAYYRLPAGKNFNLDANLATLVIDGKALTPPAPTGKGWADRISWGRHGHVAFTGSGTMIHAVERLRKPWWWIPAPMPWALIETNMAMRNPRVLDENLAEPSYSAGRLRGLTCISTAGKGAIVTPFRTFPKAVDDTSVGWFDPHLSPDGLRVVWLVAKQWLPIRWELALGDVTTGSVRTLTPGEDWVLQSDALWLDDDTVVSSRKGQTDTGFRIVTTDMDGAIIVLSGPEHGSLEALWPVTP